MRRCARCGTTKPLGEFHRISDRRSSGRDCYCRTCRNAITADYKRQNRDRILEAKRRHYASNLELERTRHRLKHTRRRIRAKSCVNCQDGEHGPQCQGATVNCRCRCRAVLGLEGPFEFGDPTATGSADIPDPDEERVA